MFHKIIIVGRLGADPEQKYTVDGKPSNGHKQPGADVERFRELYRKQKQGAK